MSAAPFDLLIRAGRLLCPETGLDAPGAVAVRGDRIAASGVVSGAARVTLDYPDGLLLPGLVDMHAHPARAGSKYGVDPDRWMLPRGTTTVLSQGDAGALNCDAFRAETVEACRTRVRLALNLAARGESRPGPCCDPVEEADPALCAAAAIRGGETVWGIAVNTSPQSCGVSDPREVMRRALAAAEESGKPLLVGTRRHPDWPLGEQLPLLRPGDVVTYCFHSRPEGLVEEGRVRRAVWEARERGVLFDLGHGLSSFGFHVAEAAIGEGFYPDTLSTDFYRGHVDAGLAHDLPLTLAKIRAAGMPEPELFRAATARPAALLGLAGEIGTLAPGSCADLVVLRGAADGPPLRDAVGGERAAPRWEPVLVVRAGAAVGGGPATERIPGPDS